MHLWGSMLSSWTPPGGACKLSVRTELRMRRQRHELMSTALAATGLAASAKSWGGCDQYRNAPPRLLMVDLETDFGATGDQSWCGFK